MNNINLPLQSKKYEHQDKSTGIDAYTLPMGEKGGSSTTDGGAFSLRLFFCCFFSSAVTASIRRRTSSSRSNLCELEYSLCFPFSRLNAIEASEQCNREMQTENACNADNRAWKSTKNCSFPFAFMERAGSSSLLPCLNNGSKSQLLIFGVRM